MQETVFQRPHLWQITPKEHKTKLIFHETLTVLVTRLRLPQLGEVFEKLKMYRLYCRLQIAKIMNKQNRYKVLV
jgi:hypothetical protein